MGTSSYMGRLSSRLAYYFNKTFSSSQWIHTAPLDRLSPWRPYFSWMEEVLHAHLCNCGCDCYALLSLPDLFGHAQGEPGVGDADGGLLGGGLFEEPVSGPEGAREDPVTTLAHSRRSEGALGPPDKCDGSHAIESETQF